MHTHTPVAEKTRQTLEEATGGGECNVQADNATSNVTTNENAPSDNENANKNLPRDNENRTLREGEGGPRLEKQSTFSKEMESGLLDDDRDRELKGELLVRGTIAFWLAVCWSIVHYSYSLVG